MNFFDVIWFFALIFGLIYIGDHCKDKKPKKTKGKPILLVDMDGVIADYYSRFVAIWRLRHPGRPVVHPDDLKGMYLEDSYPDDYAYDIRSINTSAGFFEGMAEIEGAAETLNRILDEGEFEVFLCSTPDTSSVNHGCASEKVRWVEQVLGKRWIKKIILTHDKTLVAGHFLIDDKPDIKGVFAPSWKQIVFTHAYNKYLTQHYRLNKWSEWDKLSHILLAEFNQTK